MRGAATPMNRTYLPRRQPSQREGPDERAAGGWPSPPDPGDLSRRVALRRAQLGLSVAQVAGRAGMSARYLEYLERYPARPPAGALRRLAAALRTTPAALLGAGAQAPPGQSAAEAAGATAAQPVIATLTPVECRRLIAAGGVGRIAFGAGSGPPRDPARRIAPHAAGSRHTAMGRRRPRGVRAHRPRPDHRPPHRDPPRRPLSRPGRPGSVRAARPGHLALAQARQRDVSSARKPAR
jgi:transcriptional regulator with XRE-family HTH domain